SMRLVSTRLPFGRLAVKVSRAEPPREPCGPTLDSSLYSAKGGPGSRAACPARAAQDGSETVKRSTERILTTHTGSLPRPDDLVQWMLAREGEQEVDLAHLEERIRSATVDAVQQQVGCGVDVASDGEMSKPGYSNYVKDRLTGFSGKSGMKFRPEWADFPEYFEANRQDAARANLRTPACTGPVQLEDPEAVHRDIANLRAPLDALGDAQPTEVFMTAASPGVIAHFLENQYYGSDEAYLAALADAMRPEYEAIATAGFVLQLDCPDLAMSRHMGANAGLTTEQFR